MKSEYDHGETTPSVYRRVLSNPQFGLILAVTFVGMLEAALAPALPAIADALQISDGRVGLLITFFKVPSILVVPVAAIVADRYGRRVVLLPSLVLFGVVGTAMFFVETFVVLLAMAAVMGIGAAAIFPITVTMLGDVYSGAANATAQGFRVAIVGIAAISIPALSGYLSGLSWNYPFALFALAFPVIVLVSLFLHETIEPSASSDGVSRLTRQYSGAIRTELLNPDVRILVLGGFVRGFVRYGVLTFIPLFAVRVLDASLFEAGALLAVRGFAYVSVSPVSGSIVGRIGRKRALIVAMLVSTTALVAIPFTSSLLILSIAVFAYFAGDALFDPVMKDAVTTFGHDDYLAGVVNTLYVLKRTGQTVSPAIFGFVLTLFGYETLFVAAAAVVFAYLVAFRTTFSATPRSR
ncbi:MFS transporter [Natrialba sp. INN-245]|uniref:MFS transporter n=1 Tax=Natrialba sp. INN-245 TaxID=2690967 RepID=UPI001313CF33|nr:MFS transporter [Natrialba sp. INN-245]MWV40395.1 MFS transporter [Natrialba sp. INN-245]